MLRVPARVRLIAVTGAEHQRLLEMTRGELEADRQPFPAETAWNIHGRLSADIERRGDVRRTQELVELLGLRRLRNAHPSGAREKIELAESARELLTQPRALPQRLEVILGAYQRARQHLVAEHGPEILRPRSERVLVRAEHLGDRDRRLAVLVGEQIGKHYFLDDRARRFQHLKCALDGFGNIGMTRWVTVVPAPHPADSNTFNTGVEAVRVVPGRSGGAADVGMIVPR